MAGRTLRPEVRRPARTSRAASLVRRARKASPPKAVWWLALAVVAGLFAMHGLGMHGAHTDAHAMHTEPDSSQAWGAATDHGGGFATAAVDHMAEIPAVASQPALGSVADSSPGPSGGAGVLGLCLTILTFGVMWLCARARRQPAWTILRRPITAYAAALPATAHGLSPPLRAELSIWRC